MGEDVLKAIGQLEGIHVSETILYMRVDNQFGQTKNLSRKVESISKSNEMLKRYEI